MGGDEIGLDCRKVLTWTIPKVGNPIARMAVLRLDCKDPIGCYAPTWMQLVQTLSAVELISFS